MSKTPINTAVLLLLLIAVTLQFPQAQATAMERRYFTTFDFVNLSKSQSSNGFYNGEGSSGDNIVYWAVDVWILHYDDSLTNLTDGSGLNPFILFNRTAVGEGYQSGLWSAPQTILNISDSLQVDVYINSGVAYWSEGSFKTEPLNSERLESALWDFTLYTKRTYNGVSTVGYWYWSNSTYNSRIENIRYYSAQIPSFIWAFAGIGGGLILSVIIVPYLLAEKKSEKT